MNDRIPPLTIESDEAGGFLLEQDYSGNVDRIELHPTQVRYLAELAGLLPQRGDDYMPPAAVLARRLRTLLDRINMLDEWLHLTAQNGREDLSMECTYSLATWELATEFCADLDGLATASRKVTRDAAPSTAPSTATAETRAEPNGNPAGSAPAGEQLTLAG